MWSDTAREQHVAVVQMPSYCSKNSRGEGIGRVRGAVPDPLVIIVPKPGGTAGRGDKQPVHWGVRGHGVTCSKRMPSLVGGALLGGFLLFCSFP